LTLWKGRIPGGLAPEAWRFLHSLPHDRHLWPDDIVGTMAHVRALEDARVLTREEARSMLDRLSELHGHPELIDETDEDVHSAIERLLTYALGPLGAKVHAGRSRNDQVATAMRLRTRREVLAVWEAVVKLGEAIATRAGENVRTLAPGYTHLQRAQPVTIGHWLAAHGFAFLRDADRLREAYRAADVSPLGAGALAGNTLGTDPAVGMKALGFSQRFRNSIDAVSDRDYLCDAAYAATMAGSHLSRLAEELVLWSSTEFGFVRLPDRYATGSSMMPQKRNPDVAELARAQVGTAAGALVGLLLVTKGLPLAYDRDLQADKQNLGDAFASVEAAFTAMAGLVSEIGFDTERLAAACSDDAQLATDLAEALVGRGVPFRTAHERVARLARGPGSLREALEAEPDAMDPLTQGEALALLEPAAAVQRRTTPGGPSAASVKRQVSTLSRHLAKHRELIGGLVRTQPSPASVRRRRQT